MVTQTRALILCNRELRLYDLSTGILVTKLKGVMNQKMPYYGTIGGSEGEEGFCIALSRNRMTVNIMSLETGDLTTTFKVGEDRFLNSLLVSANGAVCVCGDETQKPFPLLVWDLRARKLLYDLRFNHHDFITRLSAISDDAHYVVCVAKEVNSSAPNFVVVYDLQSGMLFKKLKPEVDSTSIAISSASRSVINGVCGGNLLIWDLATGDRRHELKGHSSDVDTIRVSENGKIFLSYDSTGKDPIIRVWDVEKGSLVKEFNPTSILPSGVESSGTIKLSSCQLSPSGRSIIYAIQGHLEVFSLPVTGKEEETGEPYGGDSSLEGKEFDVKE